MIVRPFVEQGHFTQLHNLLFDLVMPRLSASAWKVLCLIVRRTRGWGRKSDSIPYDEIMDGTGIRGRGTVSAALCELLDETPFGSPLILRQTAEERGVSRRESTRYALNRQFRITVSAEFAVQKLNREYADSGSSEIEPRKKVRSPEIEPTGSSEIEPRNPVAYKDRARLTEEKYEESTYSGGGGVLHTPAREETPPPQSANNFSSPILTALCEVCGLLPDALEAGRDRHETAILLPWLREEAMPGADDEAVATAVRVRYALPPRGAWDRNAPPRLSQIRKDWKRMELIAARAVAPSANGSQRPLTRAQQREVEDAEIERRIRESLEHHGITKPGRTKPKTAG